MKTKTRTKPKRPAPWYDRTDFPFTAGGLIMAGAIAAGLAASVAVWREYAQPAAPAPVVVTKTVVVFVDAKDVMPTPAQRRESRCVRRSAHWVQC